MNDCIFCKIVSGEIPSRKIGENSGAIAFLDIYPASKGHALVIPKGHYRDIFEIPESDSLEVMKLVREIALKYKEFADISNINIVSSNGRAAEQDIFHLHIHVVPRFEGDKKSFWTNMGKGQCVYDFDEFVNLIR